MRVSLMPEFIFTNPTGAISMSDVLITIATFFAAWTKVAQKAKDEQLKSRDEAIRARDEHIKWLQQQLDKQRVEEDTLRQKLRDQS